jgi:membrane-associated phospholipid phosphatase
MPSWFGKVGELLAYAGQGGPLAVIALLLAAVRARSLRTIRPIVLWVMSFGLLFLLVGLPKIYFRRGAPGDSQGNAVELFSKPFCGTPECTSYPSGHAANSVVWYGLAMLLLQGLLGIGVRRAIRVAAVIVVGLATVVSGYHWASDTVAGVAAGWVAYLVVQQSEHSRTLPFLASVDRWIDRRGIFDVGGGKRS